MRVMIADDEPKVRQLIRMFLEQENFLEPVEIIGEARNGAAALQLIRQALPEIVITDIRMPGCSGLELIRQARELAPMVSFIIISGYELFEYAHEAIKYGVEDYLLKPLKKDELLHAVNCIIEKRVAAAGLEASRSELTENLKRVSVKKQESLLRHLSRHELTCSDAWDRNVLREKYDFHLSAPAYLVAILKVDASDTFEHADFSGFLERQAERAIDKYLSAFQQMHWISGAYIYILLGLQAQQELALRKAAGFLIYELRSSSNVVSGIHVTAALSKPAPSPSSLPESFATAEFALQNRLIRGVDRVLDGETPCDMHDVRDFVNMSVRKKLLSELECQNFGQTMEIIQRLGVHVMAAQGCTGRLIRRVAGELLDLILFSVKDVLSPEEQEKRRKQTLLRLDMCPDAGNVFDTLCKQLTKLLEACRLRRGQQDAKPVKQAKRFIRMYYGQDISQEEAADAVGLSASYLSTLFKKETGMSFSEFLTETRIHAACDLLLSTNNPIAQIAETVGYNDVKYFTKVFRKTAGLSPSAYRKLYY